MALRWIEGFELYGTGTGSSTQTALEEGVIAKWDSAYFPSGVYLAEGRVLGKCLHSQGNSGNWFRKQFAEAKTTWIVGFAMKGNTSDGDGSANNDFIGPAFIEGLLPTSDGNSSDWTPSSGIDNYALIDENPSDRDGTDSVSTITQDAKDTYGYAASQLALGHSATVTVGRVATSTLELSQQASFTIDRFVSASSTLNLHQAVNAVLGEGCVDRSYTPFIGSTDDPNAPAPPSSTVPTLQCVEGIELYWPVSSPMMAVSLRGPELDNKDRLRFQRINRETRGGTLVVFADPIWPKVQQLTLEFVGLEENEAQSLLSFITATLGKEVGLRDWEDRHWSGVIVSPDEPIIRNGPRNISTALEFEGVPA